MQSLYIDLQSFSTIFTSCIYYLAASRSSGLRGSKFWGKLEIVLNRRIYPIDHFPGRYHCDTLELNLISKMASGALTALGTKYENSYFRVKVVV